jgi:phosphoenolpyruvate carboxykinase (ATP)
MLGEKIETRKTKCWLVNTGWVGGPFGVGERINLEYTAMVGAAVDGRLEGVPAWPHPVFMYWCRKGSRGVPGRMLDARGLWSDPAAYDDAALALSNRFHENFKRFAGVQPKIMSAAPVAP